MVQPSPTPVSYPIYSPPRQSLHFLRYLTKSSTSPLPSNLAVVALLTLLFATYHVTRFVKYQQVKRRWRASERARRELIKKESERSSASGVASSSTLPNGGSSSSVGKSSVSPYIGERPSRSELGAKKRKKSKASMTATTTTAAVVDTNRSSSVATTISPASSITPFPKEIDEPVIVTTKPASQSSGLSLRIDTKASEDTSRDSSDSKFQVVLPFTSKRRNKINRSTSSPNSSSTPTVGSNSQSRDNSTDPSSPPASTTTVIDSSNNNDHDEIVEKFAADGQSTASSCSGLTGQDGDFSPASSIQTTPTTSINSSTQSLAISSAKTHPVWPSSPLDQAGPPKETSPSLEHEVESLRASLSTALSTLSSMQSTLASSQSSLLGSHAQLSDVTAERDTLARSATTFKSELADLTTSIARSESRAVSAEEKQTELSAEVEQLRKDLERARREVEDGRRWGEERRKESEDLRRKEKAGRREIEKFKEEGRKWEVYEREFRRREYELRFQLHHLSTMHTTLLHHARQLEAHLRETNYAFAPMPVQTPMAIPPASSGSSSSTSVSTLAGASIPAYPASPSPSSQVGSLQSPRQPRSPMGFPVGVFVSIADPMSAPTASSQPHPYQYPHSHAHVQTHSGRGKPRRGMSSSAHEESSPGPSSGSVSVPVSGSDPSPAPPASSSSSSEEVTKDVLTSILKTSSTLHNGSSHPPLRPPPLISSTSSFLGHPTSQTQPTVGMSKEGSTENGDEGKGRESEEDEDQEISFASIMSYDANASPLPRPEGDDIEDGQIGSGGGFFGDQSSRKEQDEDERFAIGLDLPQPTSGSEVVNDRKKEADEESVATPTVEAPIGSNGT
ncbi:hypothetical protein [Phaffia rhodozyma]|uniref:Uncharacterized protein n=1 Tax=Phaffia rhodozyma TaxID=264483 RepID=A0A0F7SM78_PHARH|nr:hypothetical protein [Phaffia rhodozyma]